MENCLVFVDDGFFGLVKKVSKFLMVPVAALTLATAGLVSPPKVEADEGFYVGMQGEYFVPSNSAFKEIYENMWGLGVRAGYETDDGLRIGANFHSKRAEGSV